MFGLSQFAGLCGDFGLSGYQHLPVPVFALYGPFLLVQQGFILGFQVLALDPGRAGIGAEDEQGYHEGSQQLGK